ncbi:MAG: VTT domain-containing protein [Bacteroidia bacterium]|nr:VTT domain-containing protein [Bacteroidia bacterium]
MFQEIIELLNGFKHLIDPEFIISYGGLSLLAIVVFAETGLMIGFFLPGDSLLFTAGLLCATGIFQTNILILTSVLVVAAIAGDQTGYIIGRKAGETLFKRDESWFFKPKYVEKTKDFYNRHGGKTIVMGRFVPIVRTFAPMVAGVAKLEYSKFVFFNISGGILWVLSMTLSGYFLGRTIPGIKEYLEVIVIGIIIVSVIPIIVTWLKERKLSKNLK